ncbi:hypothetical protein BDY21DRAFT_372706 [Lineolata rhizophorae]|uniref:DNA repair protein Rad26 n=1 Tax=Lineolata rhizophorae TaxID=578093 RepID=A0A6A6NWX9_9PEZI|nr:hypothetical protein BDY21DRAFT_372706 [Lineolata rhizophorae]
MAAANPFDDDDDAFSDDDLDAASLQQIEDAWRAATQQQPPQHKRPAAAPTATRSAINPQFRPQPLRTPETRLSDYGLDDDDDEAVIDLGAQDGAGLQTYSNGAIGTNALDTARNWGGLGGVTAGAGAGSGTGAGWGQQPQGAGAGAGGPGRNTGGYDATAPMHGAMLQQLQQRIAELEREKDELQRSEREASSAVVAKAGEVAIVRRNLEKATRDYDQRVAALQRAHADAVAKHNLELEAAWKERERVETNNRFLEHDLTHHARAPGRKQMREVGAGNRPRTAEQKGDATATTPKKSKALPFRDGFDDGDVLMASPPKKDRSKPATPRAAAKRKRPVPDASPVQPLPLSEPSSRRSPDLDVGEPMNEPESQPHSFSVPNVDSTNEDYEFLQFILNHRPYPGNEQTFEAFAKYSFPSEPDGSISSMIHDHLQFPSEAKSLPHKFANILLLVWDRCLDEAYYPPISILLDTIHLTLSYVPLRTTLDLITTLLPLAQATADLVAIPLAKASTATNNNTTKQRPLTHSSSSSASDLAELQRHIDVHAVLLLLYDVATTCAPDPAASAVFWASIKYDFVLVMLMRAHPLEQVVLTLKMLGTSATTSSFGATITTAAAKGDGASAVAVDEAREQQRQAANESALVDRVTQLLAETAAEPSSGWGRASHSCPSPPAPARSSQPPPPPPPSRQPRDATSAPPRNPVLATERLRLAALETLSTLTLHARNAALLAAHPLALPRLARFLVQQLDTLDAYADPLAEARELTVRSVNAGAKVLCFLLGGHGGGAAGGAGGVIKSAMAGPAGKGWGLLVGLARVAFCEGEAGLMERGIEEETVEAAHAVLDEWLSPEEGEELVRVFSQAGGGEGTGVGNPAAVSSRGVTTELEMREGRAREVDLDEDADGDGDEDDDEMEVNDEGYSVDVDE